MIGMPSTSGDGTLPKGKGRPMREKELLEAGATIVSVVAAPLASLKISVH